MNPRTSLLVGLFATLAACGSSSSPAGSSPDASTTHDGNGSTPNGPVILSLTTTVSRVTDTGSVTIVAVVTEPTGLENLVGGTLTSSDGALTYGAFVATTQGTYSLTLSWGQLSAVAKIEFTSELALDLQATFFNKAGAKTVQAVPRLELYCGAGSAVDAACDSSCVQLDTVKNCGSCGATCPDASSSQVETSPTSCAAGACVFEGGFAAAQAPALTCAAACGGATPTAACASATAMMTDGSTQALACTTSFASFTPTTTQSATVNDLYCECGTQLYVKSKAGTCATECPAASPCTHTVAQVTYATNVGDDLLDSCTAPYAYANWTPLLDTNTAFAVTVSVRPEVTTCNCATAPTAP